MPGAGDFRYVAIAFASGAFHASTPSKTTSRLPEPKSAIALHAATASSPLSTAASWSSTASGSNRLRRRATARSTFGRSLPPIR